MKELGVLFENNSSIMLLIDATNGKIADANLSALKFYGYGYKKMLTLNIADINILPKKEVKKQVSAIQNGKITQAYYKHRTADNQIKDVKADLSPVQLNGRKLNFAIVHDVTELKLKEAEANRFWAISENAVSYIGIANMKREVFYFNKSMRKAFAIPDSADLSAYKVFDFYTPKGIETIQKAFGEIEKKGFWIGENEMKSLDGRIMQVIQTVVLIRDEKGIPQYTSSTAIDITLQKQAEHELTKTASHYKTLLKTSSDGIHILDSNLNLVETNDAFCKMLGYTSKEMEKMSIPDWDIQWSRPELKKEVNRMLTRGAIFETRHRRKDGTVIDVEINATGVTVGDKKYLYASARDISERKTAEQKIKTSEAKFRSLVDNSFDAIGVHYNGTWKLCNQAALKLFGYNEADELIGKPILNVIAPEEHTRLKQYVDNRAKGIAAPDAYLMTGLRKDGTRFDMEVSITRFMLDGQYQVMAIMRDISERKRLEAMLKESEENLIQGELIGKYGYWKAYVDTQKFEYTPGVAKIYGVKESGVTATVFKRMRLPEYNDQMEAAMKELINNSKPLNQVFKIKRESDGQIISIRATLHYNSNDRIISGIIQDISERVKAQVDLRKSEEKYRSLIANLEVGVVVHGPGSEIILNNSKALELLGLSAGQIIGKTPFHPQWKVIHEDGSDFPVDTYPVTVAFQTKKTVKDVVMGVFRPSTNDRVWLLVTAFPEIENDGNVRQVIVTFSDITWKRRKEEVILSLNRELKELTSHLQRLRTDERNNLALEFHDKLGQRLIGLKYETDFLRNTIKEDQHVSMDKIKEISEEISAMLLDFTSIYNEVHPTLIDDLGLFDALEILIDAYRKKGKLKIIFTTDIEGEEFSHDSKWVIYKTVEESLDNVITHANASRVTVALNRSADELILKIHDNGCGFEIDALKSEDKIGLIEMRERVDSLGGDFVFDSGPGLGTTIGVTIPHSNKS